MHRFVLFLTGILFISTIGLAQSPPPTADAVLHEATQVAAKEHKKVFIIFHASWCGWCHRMDSLMNKPACKKFFDDNYVIRHLVVFESKDKKALENPGALDMLTKYHGEKSGIPFWLIFDGNGQLLADSRIGSDDAGPDAAGDNTGCPATKEEVAYFIKVLRKTASLHKDQLTTIGDTFRKAD